MCKPGKLLADKVWAQLTKPRKQLSHHVSHHLHLHVNHVQLHVGRHVHLHFSLHVGHRNIISTLCEGSETLTIWKSEIITATMSATMSTSMSATISIGRDLFQKFSFSGDF